MHGSRKTANRLDDVIAFQEVTLFNAMLSSSLHGSRDIRDIPESDITTLYQLSDLA